MFRYIKARIGQFLGVMVLVVVSMAALSGSSVVTQLLIDAVISQDLSGVRLYIPVAIGYSVIAATVYVVCTVCRDVFSAALMNDIRLSVFDGIMRRGRRDFAENHTADYISALTNDMSTIEGRFLGILFMLVIAVSSMIFSAALMLYYQPLIAVCAVLGALIITVAPMILGRVIGKWQKLRSERLAAFTAMLSECFSGFETITTFGIGHHIRRRFRECSAALRDCEYRTNGLSALSDSASQLLSGLAQTAILAMSCLMVLTGRMSVGALVIFISLNTTFCGALSTYLMVFPLLKGTKPVIDRINCYADYEIADTYGQTAPAFKDAVTVRELSFGYDNETAVLDSLSLTLKRGGKYALTGESGCGKSTLIHLLTGDYPDYDGGIFYDGTELHELKQDELCRVVACIHQDVFMFDDTIRNNICLYDDFSEEQFRWAIKASGVGKFAEELPGGVSYVVGEHGERLSGGQKQRIAIARALIRNTSFLILDEGTSALDEDTAAAIEGELLGMDDLTLLTITHHLKNPQKYDAVFYLSGGKVTEA